MRLARPGRSSIVDPQRSELMRRVRQRDTDPELTVRRVLSELGARYRVNVSSLPGSPDIVNQRQRVAILVHGCFWHRHEGCRLATTPKTNAEFWTSKFSANRERDGRKLGELENLGLRVLVVWQCETSDVERLRERLRTFWWPAESA